MRRTKKSFRPADAILTGDIELRAFTPACRIDDHWQTQARKIKWLKDLQEKHCCPILDSGDLFDKRYKANPSHKLLNWAIENMPRNMITIPGNHDLPGKSIDNYDNSAMAVMENAGCLIKAEREHAIYKILADKQVNIYGYGWGVPIEDGNESLDIDVALVHAMVYDKFEPWPDCEGYNAKEILRLLPNKDLIVTGHHHATFVETSGSRVLVNPGSFMRNDADQEDHKPCVFLWYADSNEVEQVFIPIEEGVIDRSYLDDKVEKSKRLDAFIEKLGDQASTGINFQNNLEKTVDSSKIKQSIKNKVWQYYEEL